MMTTVMTMMMTPWKIKWREPESGVLFVSFLPSPCLSSLSFSLCSFFPDIIADTFFNTFDEVLY